MEVRNKQQLIQGWLNGANQLGIEFAYDEKKEGDKEEAEKDLDRFSDFCLTKSLEEMRIFLQLVLTYHPSVGPEEDTLFENIYPRLYFKQIDWPYEVNCKRILDEYQIEAFLPKSNMRLKERLKKIAGRGQRPLYISFIKLDKFYIVNLFSSPISGGKK